MPVSQTAWVDNGAFSPNRGQFPIQVERHLNAFVADHLPGVTTVTLGARYYSLHGHVAYTPTRSVLMRSRRGACCDVARSCWPTPPTVTPAHPTIQTTPHLGTA